MSPPPTVTDLHARTRIQWTLLEVLRQAAELDPGTDVTPHLRDLVDQIDGIRNRAPDFLNGRPSLEDRVRDVEELLNVSQVAVGEVEVLTTKVLELEGRLERAELRLREALVRLEVLDDPDRLARSVDLEALIADRTKVAEREKIRALEELRTKVAEDRKVEKVEELDRRLVKAAAELADQAIETSTRLVEGALLRPVVDLPTEQGGPLLEAQDAQELEALEELPADELEVEPAADLPEALEERDRSALELDPPAAHRRAPDGPKVRAFRDVPAHVPNIHTSPLRQHGNRKPPPMTTSKNAPIDLGPKVAAPPGRKASDSSSSSSSSRVELGPPGSSMPRGGRRAQLLELLRRPVGEGLTIAELLELVGVEPSDKPGRHRIEVAVSAMVRDGALERVEGRRSAKPGNPSGARYRAR